MRISKKIIIAFIAVTFFSACNQEEDVVYSCDKVTNEWTKENLAEIRLMSRADWKKLDEVKKRAAYRAFTPNQKFVFWKEKFSEVKTLNWSDAERLHIQKAEDFINAHASFFNNLSLTEEENDELELFFYKWKEEAISSFGWPKELPIAIAGSGNEIENNNKETLILGIGQGGGFKDDDLDCNCTDRILSDFCFSAGPCDSRINCIHDVSGCGWLLQQECNGRCSAIIH